MSTETATPAAATTPATPSLKLLPLGDASAAVCDGDVCVIPD